MGHGARGGRVGLLAVAVGGVGGAREADWDVAMFRPGGSRWPNGSGCPGGQRGAAPSVVEHVGQRLVEHEVRDWFGLGGIEGRSLVEEEVPLRRTTSG